jgi:Dyp-type peroxidase family
MSESSGNDTDLPVLKNDRPIDPLDPANRSWLLNLQGNILNGHGRDHTVHLFLRLPADAALAREVVRERLAPLVTSAHKQEMERVQFKEYGIPGRLFGSVLLSANGYRKLGFAEAELREAFDEEPESIRDVQSNFLDGMAMHAEADLGDPAPAQWEEAYARADIDAMVLLADDDAAFLSRSVRQLIDSLEGRCEIAHIERGTALRNDDGEGIEHFGYVDGRSQPLFLTSDFVDLVGGAIGAGTREKDGGLVDRWNPFEPLELVLREDTLAGRGDCLGSFFVFRKLEQNVRDFTIHEQLLADKLGLKQEDRERAGAMVVGRFRDGTPLALSRTDGFDPPKENNFRYDTDDRDGLRCPFHAHIRKTNPRGDIMTEFGVPEEEERRRRVARRGITYGTRNRHPNAFQALDDLPSGGVGLLFMCFQRSIRAQFAFMQRSWANNLGFVKPGITGLDPVIGQPDQEPVGSPVTPIDQSWRPEYGAAEPVVKARFGGFVAMKGGEFFFAPSIPFLRDLA